MQIMKVLCIILLISNVFTHITKLLETPNNIKEYSISTYNTSSLLDLTKINISCDEYSAISKISFFLDKSLISKILCRKIDSAIFGKETIYTPWNEIFSDINNSFHYLDRHSVDCGKNKILNSVKLEFNSETNKIRYSAICYSVLNLQCKNANGPVANLGGWSNHEINGMIIGNPENGKSNKNNSMLSSFKFNIKWNQEGGNDKWYEYSDCLEFEAYQENEKSEKTSTVNFADDENENEEIKNDDFSHDI